MVEYPDIGLEHVVIGCDFAVDDGVILADFDALYLLAGDVLGVLVELQLELVAEEPQLAVVVVSGELLAVFVVRVVVLLRFLDADGVDSAIGDRALGLLLQVVVFQ